MTNSFFVWDKQEKLQEHWGTLHLLMLCPATKASCELLRAALALKMVSRRREDDDDGDIRLSFPANVSRSYLTCLADPSGLSEGFCLRGVCTGKVDSLLIVALASGTSRRNAGVLPWLEVPGLVERAVRGSCSVVGS